MFFKSFKVNRNILDSKASVEFFWITSDEKNFDLLIKVLEVFELSMPLSCRCSYDKDRLIVKQGATSIEVTNLEPKKKFRVITLQEVKITIVSETVLKDLLRLSNEYDAMLIITSRNEHSKTELIINDNGHDYINFDKSQYDVKEVKKKLAKS